MAVIGVALLLLVGLVLTTMGGGKRARSGGSKAATSEDREMGEEGSPLANVEMTEQVKAVLAEAERLHPSAEDCAAGKLSGCECDIKAHVNCRMVKTSGKCTKVRCWNDCRQAGGNRRITNICVSNCMKKRTCTYSNRVCEGPICAAWAGVKRVGKRDGLWLEHHKKKRGGHYLFRGYDDTINAVIKSKKHFSAGLSTGTWEQFYDNGKAQTRHVYNDGLPTGTWTSWYRSGKKRSERSFKDNVDVHNIRYWNEHGQRAPCADDFRSHYTTTKRECRAKNRAGSRKQYRRCFQTCQGSRGKLKWPAAKTHYHSYPMSTASRASLGTANARGKWIGPVSSWYPTGERRSLSQYVRIGKPKHATALHGRQQHWHKNGKLRLEQMFDRGVLVRETAWHEDGTDHYLTPYSAGKLHGERKIWHPNGKLMFQCHFAQGEKHGPCKRWGAQDNPLWSYTFKKGRLDGSAAAWHDNGKQKSKRSYKNGQAIGAVEYWHPNGQRAQRGDFDSGKFVNFDASGNPLPGFQLNAGNGRYVRYYGNGKIAVEGELDDGHKQGLWSTYYEDGTKKRTATYTIGTLNGPSESWHNNGRLKEKGDFKDGNKHRLWREGSATVSVRDRGKYARPRKRFFFKRWQTNYKMGKPGHRRRAKDAVISAKKARHFIALQTASMPPAAVQAQPPGKAGEAAVGTTDGAAPGAQPGGGQLAPAAQDDKPNSYIARLGPADHLNSRGKPLTSAAAVLSQDRANVHKFGKADPQDQRDGHFRTRAARGRMLGLLKRGGLSSQTAQIIMNRTPLVQVTNHGQFIEVKVLENGAKLPVSATTR